jgi:hypothetical protein
MKRFVNQHGKNHRFDVVELEVAAINYECDFSESATREHGEE